MTIRSHVVCAAFVLFTGILTWACSSRGSPPPASLPRETPKPSAIQPKENLSDEVVVQGMQFKLEECLLSYEKDGRREAVDLGLPPPCQFERDENGTIRVLHDKGRAVLLGVSSKPLPPEVPGQKSLQCDKQLRAIVVSQGGVALSRSTQKIWSCASADEKMFHILGADTGGSPPASKVRAP